MAQNLACIIIIFIIVSILGVDYIHPITQGGLYIGFLDSNKRLLFSSVVFLVTLASPT